MLVPTLALFVVASSAPVNVIVPIEGADLIAMATANLRVSPDIDANGVRLALMQDESTPEPIEGSDTTVAFGTADTARWSLLGGVGHNLDDDSEAFVGAGLSYFVATRLSFELEFNGWYFNVEEGSAWGINSNLLIRWHFWQSDDTRWTLFGEGGGGLLIATENVPSTGSDFNFTPILGGGFSLDIGQNNRLIAGARWHHISNANTRSDNPGQDNLLFFAGVSFPF